MTANSQYKNNLTHNEKDEWKKLSEYYEPDNLMNGYKDLTEEMEARHNELMKKYYTDEDGNTELWVRLLIDKEGLMVELNEQV